VKESPKPFFKLLFLIDLLDQLTISTHFVHFIVHRYTLLTTLKTGLKGYISTSQNQVPLREWGLISGYTYILIFMTVYKFSDK
jgi:hypothetical protein